jgi:hypothetical protein
MCIHIYIYADPCGCAIRRSCEDDYYYHEFESRSEHGCSSPVFILLRRADHSFRGSLNVFVFCTFAFVFASLAKTVLPIAPVVCSKDWNLLQSAGTNCAA